MATLTTLLATPSSAVLVPLSEAGGEESGLAGAIGIGVLALVILVAMVLGLMAFGKGRDHS